MRRKQIAVMSAVFALLAALAFVSLRPRQDLRREEVTVFPGLDGASVAQIAIEGGGERILLERSGEGWLAGDSRYPADGQRIENLLADLAELKRLAVAARKGGEGDGYGLGPGEGSTVTLTRSGGDGAVVFTVGRGGPDGFSGYIVLAGSEEVLLVATNLELLFARSLEGWRDREIVKAGPDEIVQVVIAGDGEPLTLAKGDAGAWTAGGVPAGAGAVTEYLERLTNLRAAAFAPAGGDERADFEEPEAEVTYLTDAGSATIVIGALDEGEKQRFVREAGGEVIYLVSRFAAEDLVKSAADFPPPAGESGEEGR